MVQLTGDANCSLFLPHKTNGPFLLHLVLYILGTIFYYQFTFQNALRVEGGQYVLGRSLLPNSAAEARERPDQVWSPPGARVVSGLEADYTHFRLVMRLRMSGAILLVPLYAFVACPETDLRCTFLHLPTFCAAICVVPGTQNTTAALF